MIVSGSLGAFAVPCKLAGMALADPTAKSPVRCSIGSAVGNRYLSRLVARSLKFEGRFQVQAAWAIPSNLNVIDVNGYPLTYVQRGSGVPLILVHGSTADYRVVARGGKLTILEGGVAAPTPRDWYGSVEYPMVIHCVSGVQLGM
jgi:hypothetical protein